jgi:hypothetical protein
VECSGLLPPWRAFRYRRPCENGIELLLSSGDKTIHLNFGIWTKL